MIEKLVNSPTAIWTILVSFTLVSLLIVEGTLLGPYSSIVIVLIAAAKSRMVILHYMEAKHAPQHWRFLYETWNFAATAIIVIGQYMTMTGVAAA